VVKDEKGDPLPDSRNILNMGKNYFFRLLNAHLVSGVRNMVIDRAEIKFGFSIRTQFYGVL
jgi:hypothetical protein